MIAKGWMISTYAIVNYIVTEIFIVLIIANQIVIIICI